MALLSLPTLLMANRMSPRLHAAMCDRMRETALSVRKYFCVYQSAQLAAMKDILLHTVRKWHAAMPPSSRLLPLHCPLLSFLTERLDR